MGCKQCEEPPSPGAKFCSNCGASVAEANLLQPDADPATDLPGDKAGSKGKAIKRYAQDVATEAKELGAEALKSEFGKKLAAGAGIGAVVAIPIPLVGPAVGALVGAGIVAFRRFTK